MAALCADLLYLFFNSVNMHRWNDHMRPVDLTELDKQAHKAAIAWVLGKYEESEGNMMDWTRLIEHTMFSFIQRSVLTDLKPQVFHKIVSEKREQVNSYVSSEFDRLVPDADPGFRDRFQAYLAAPGDSREDAVIRAAHYLATRWEFNLIYDSNRSLYGIDQTRQEINEQIGHHKDLVGVRELNEDTFDFIDLVGQLRFQQRWARTPRVPRTTVLGHSLMVADMMYLADLDAGASDRQVYNDFYSGLFHDLPEVLTKDVISPIKENVNGLALILEEYEHEQVESTIMPLLKEEWRDGFRMMVYDPFSDCDDAVFGPRNGTDLKTCDMVAAYMEAMVSRRYGISSTTLSDGELGIRDRLLARHGKIDTRALIAGLDAMKI